MKHGDRIRVVDDPRSVWHGSGIAGRSGRFVGEAPRLRGHSIVAVEFDGGGRVRRVQHLLADTDFYAVDAA